MTSAAAFTKLNKHIGSLLTKEGFVGARNIFRIALGSNIGVIELQKSLKSTAERVLFTLNLGIWSDCVARFLSKTVSDQVGIEDCHWRERAGFLLGTEDKWWAVEGGDLGGLPEEMSSLLPSVIVPSLREHADDEALRDEWLKGQSPGLTNMQRLLYLTILVKQIGPANRFEEILAELVRQSEGKPTEDLVARHVQKLSDGIG